MIELYSKQLKLVYQETNAMKMWDAQLQRYVLCDSLGNQLVSVVR